MALPVLRCHDVAMRCSERPLRRALEQWRSDPPPPGIIAAQWIFDHDSSTASHPKRHRLGQHSAVSTIRFAQSVEAILVR
jgi:hypothetical protein